eukprot:CAMPEP_0195059998 /NCGR_PEP_ID=MMETSP0448-20130528/7362_1 /TAXON_ID=66468 /ORGANISM="Heterocapsa triquestra, Strain CCMP 448" /LENGTH=1085 /DNA_ID=CAMNT_0040090345 /DNA_START=94 /DNA_END=3351 /DNA_ORIENTATION=+
MAIPWMPKEVGSRLHRHHERENVKTTYLLCTAYAGGFLGREDGKRPCWFNRCNLLPASALTTDYKEHLDKACHVICMKVRQEVTSEPALKATGGADRPGTPWQAGLLCARVIFRALFAAAAAKAPVDQKAAPVLFMGACESLKGAARQLLTQVWLEVQLQFTSRVSKYRNMKSRPTWAVLEALQHKAFGKNSGLGVQDPSVTTASNPGTKPASNLQDYLEEVLALRFAIDWLSLSMQDAQEFVEQQTRRINKRSVPKPKVQHDVVARQLQALKEKTVDSFAMMWTDDAELRGVASLAARLMDGLEGPSALPLAATLAGQMLLALWKGVEPLLEHHAKMGIARIAESQAAAGLLPPPSLQPADADSSHSSVFDRVALSYAPPSKECKELISALPRGVLGSVVKVQATYRGFIFRARHFNRARSVAAYCKAANWPRLAPLKQGEEEEDPKDKRRKKKAKKMDASKLNDEIAEFQPNVSKYLGGEPKAAVGPGGAMGSTMRSTGGMMMGGAMGNTARTSMMGSMGTAEMQAQGRSWPLPTADHRACADLFAVYMYNMYRRREVTRMWQTLCEAYERGMDVYAELLKRNPALIPMLESISAQLKRGSVVGYDKAFISKQKKQEEQAAPKIGADMFKKKPGKFGESFAGTAGPDATNKSAAGAGDAYPAGATTAAPSATATATSFRRQGATTGGLGEGQGGQSELDVAGEYLQTYLKEMDGDDSQFKDITPSVVPLSTGTSPARLPPHEFILKEASSNGKEPASEGGGVPSVDQLLGRDTSSAGAATASAGGKKKPRLDVPFCMQRVKPIWLPIKAHRFAAYRAKVLQLLPQRVLQQYVDFEKQGQYAACIKLLESATPGSLNVLSPATLVQEKPLLVETVLQLIVGYSGLCLKNQQGAVAVKLITQVLDSMSLALRALHPGHRTVLEAYLYDTALSVCYYMPQDISLSDRAESFFQQASERYVRLGHTNRYCKCCLRAGAVLHSQGHKSEAEYYTQQALKKLADAPVSSLLAVCYQNLAVHTLAQQRIADSVAHVRSYVTLLRQMPKLGNAWMQQFDNTQWLVLKAQELWPSYQQQVGMREPQALGGLG